MILFIPLSTEQDKPETDWATAATECILRRCPSCLTESIIGHGRRRKQAHDQTHDWIGIRRGICKLCQKTFTFLPFLSPPYGHYSWITRSQALWGYFAEQRPLDSAAPLVKDPDRVPSSATLRRWFRRLDSSALYRGVEKLSPGSTASPPPGEAIAIRRRTSFPFLEKTLQAMRRRLSAGEILRQGSLIVSWQTLGLFLHLLLPLRS